MRPVRLLLPHCRQQLSNTRRDVDVSTPSSQRAGFCGPPRHRARPPATISARHDQVSPALRSAWSIASTACAISNCSSSNGRSSNSYKNFKFKTALESKLLVPRFRSSHQRCRKCVRTSEPGAGQIAAYGRLPGSERVAAGDALSFVTPPESLHLFDAGTGVRLGPQGIRPSHGSAPRTLA